MRFPAFHAICREQGRVAPVGTEVMQEGEGTVRGARAADSAGTWLDSLVDFVDRRPGVAAAFLFLLNLAFKLPTIGRQSLWLDEAATISFSLPPVDFDRYIRYDASPFYYVMFTPWMRVFGTSAESVRFLSVLFSAATAPLVLRFAQRFYDTRTAIFAAALFTVSRFQFFFAQEARAYSLVCLLMVLSFHLLLTVLESRGRRQVIALGIVNALVMYTHYVAVFAFLGQLVIAVIFARRRPDRLLRYVVSQVIALALFSPLLIHVVVNWPPPAAEWLPPPKLGDLRYVYKQFAGGTHLLVVYAVLLAGLAVFGRGRRATASTCSVKGRPLVLALWAFFPVLTAWGISYVYPLFFPRYVLFASLGLYLLLAWLIAKSRLSGAAQAVLVAVLCVWTLGELAIEPHERPDWRSAIEMVRSRETTDSRVVLSPRFQYIPFAYYFSPESFRDYDRTVESLEQHGVFVVQDAKEIAARDGASGRRLIVVITDWAPTPPEEVPAWMEERGYRLVETGHFASIWVFVFDPPRAS